MAKYPIKEEPDMLITTWLQDRVQEIRWELGLDLDTRPDPAQEEKEEDGIG